MNWKECGRRRSWPTLKYNEYPGTCLEILSKPPKPSTHQSLYLSIQGDSGGKVNIFGGDSISIVRKRFI
jgi:hypothetical protein